MYIRLIRNQPKGSAITGRLVINGRWFCYTLERVGYEIPALCYPLRVTMSQKFKRLLPIVQNVPASSPYSLIAHSPLHSTPYTIHLTLGIADTTILPTTGASPLAEQAIISPLGRHALGKTNASPVVYASGSSGLSGLSETPGQAGRSAAEVELQLTQLLLQAQQEHEDIILEVIDFRPGTEYGYNTPCPPELQTP